MSETKFKRVQFKHDNGKRYGARVEVMGLASGLVDDDFKRGEAYGFIDDENYLYAFKFTKKRKGFQMNPGSTFKVFRFTESDAEKKLRLDGISTKTPSIFMGMSSGEVRFSTDDLQQIGSECIILEDLDDQVQMLLADAEWWDLFDSVAGECHRLMMYGPPATGKTTRGHLWAKKMERPVYSVTLHHDMAAQELIGHFVFKGNDTVWHDGPATRAWREGAVLVLNEIDEAAGACLTALYAILDDPSVAQMTLANGEVITPEEGFQVISTMNGTPESLPDALADRFEIKLNAWCPTPQAMENLNPDLQPMVMNGYKSVKDGDDFTGIVSYRQAASFTKLLGKGLPEEAAAKAVFGDRTDDFLLAYQSAGGTGL